MMRLAALLAASLLATLAWADRILLVPLDSRPAAGQFAQMIGRMADVDVRMPPYESLGQFTRAGNPDRVLDWLESQNLADVPAVVASADMIAYGGLIASRTEEVTVSKAMARLRRLSEIVSRAPNTRLYLFSSTMRLSLTSTKANRAWRDQVARYVELRDKLQRTGDAKIRTSLGNLTPQIPKGAIEVYDRTRLRNTTVQQELIRMMRARKFDYLVVGQDDAREFGPHVNETTKLKALAEEQGVSGLVYFCEGIDQLANVLLSRALLRYHDWTPRVRIVYSDPSAASKLATYESKPIAKSLEDQLLASGARPTTALDSTYDYTLFLNTPDPDLTRQAAFLAQLKEEVDQGFPIAVADINLAKLDGTSDPKVLAALTENARMFKLLSFAGWNTAGNTMGTAIPAANTYLLARRLRVDPLAREVAQREFLLHRFVNDWSYHKQTRPVAYKMIDSIKGASREETYGQELVPVNAFVQKDMLKHLGDTFKEQFLGQRFFAGNHQYVFVDLTDIKVFLPWPRVYEVRLEFRLQSKLLTEGP